MIKKLKEEIEEDICQQEASENNPFGTTVEAYDIATEDEIIMADD